MTQPHILVVDDNIELCRNITDIMELSGYRVTTAYDGSEALDKIGKNDFDLVLMDIKMPVMNGMEVFKRMKALKSHVPVIMMTAYALKDLIREALREGIFGCLKKPVDYNRLLELIDSTRAGGGMVLVVDDDEAFCRNMKDILEDKGYRVSHAVDGNEALMLAHERQFDLLLIDLKLPPLNGLETYLALRDVRPNIAAVIVSGHFGEMTTDSLCRKAKEAHAYECLEKPIKMDRLDQLLKIIEMDKKNLQAR